MQLHPSPSAPDFQENDSREIFGGRPRSCSAEAKVIDENVVALEQLAECMSSASYRGIPQLLIASLLIGRQVSHVSLCPMRASGSRKSKCGARTRAPPDGVGERRTPRWVASRVSTQDLSLIAARAPNSSSVRIASY